MRGMSWIVAVVIICVWTTVALASDPTPFWKVKCQTTPIFRGRVDPIVEPGIVSNHAHKVFGASNFDMSSKSESYLTTYDRMFASSCTTCSITIDKSAYWVADLYYKYPNGTITLVPNGGPTVYYESRSGNKDQAAPDFRAFPKGFRMTAGFPFRRNYTGTVAEKGLTWACLGETPNKEVQYFPTATEFCNNGLRAQVTFPQCWDGKNLDAPDHQSHMAYPIDRPDGGDCPDTHPVRLPMLFYEILFSVDQFPHGKGTQPFMLSCGDTTGYGLHGDFLNGWDVDIMQAALKDPSCFSNNTNNGNNAAACKPFTKYVKDSNPDMSCLLAKPIPGFEDLGINHLIPHLPGCQIISPEGKEAVQCTGSWPQNITTFAPVLRVLIMSKKSNKYLSAGLDTDPVKVDGATEILNYNHVFDLFPVDGGYGFKTEVNLHWWSATQRANGPVLASARSVESYETFTVKFYGGSGPTEMGTEASIMSPTSKGYLALQADGTLWPNAATDADVSTRFYFFDANAGVKDTRSIKF